MDWGRGWFWWLGEERGVSAFLDWKVMVVVVLVEGEKEMSRRGESVEKESGRNYIKNNLK